MADKKIDTLQACKKLEKGGMPHKVAAAIVGVFKDQESASDENYITKKDLGVFKGWLLLQSLGLNLTVIALIAAICAVLYPIMHDASKPELPSVSASSPSTAGKPDVPKRH